MRKEPSCLSTVNVLILGRIKFGTDQKMKVVMYLFQGKKKFWDPVKIQFGILFFFFSSLENFYL